MAIRYRPNLNSVPNLPQRRTVMIENLKGADLYHSTASVDGSRSPDCLNMLRSVPGKVRKRMGYFLYKSYDGRINGRYLCNGHEVVHAGRNLYYDGKIVYSAMNDARSCGFFFNNRLYLLDGANYVYLEGENVGNVSDIARVPTVMISKNPDGTGGSFLESVNILSDKWTESFYATGTDKTYQLSFGDLDSTAVSVRILTTAGTYRELAEGTDFTVDRVTGVVTFASVPELSPKEGRDNVFITASKDRTELRERITKSDVYITYGESGCGARVFVTGCPKYPNRDFWSAQDDPTFFADTDYSVLGQSNSRIIGYSLLGDCLAAHKDDAEGSVFVRNGQLVAETDADGDTVYSFVFRTGNVISGRGAVAPKSFAVLNSEVLFLTKRGICALTASDLTGEKYEQNRSFFLDSALCDEENIEEAAATVYRDFYVLAFPSGRVYLLDGLQKSYQSDQPYSTFQYEGFYWNNVPARCIWTENNRLCFGDSSGNIWHFYTDVDDVLSYNDNGKAIESRWQLGDLDGTVFYKAKNFRRCSIRVASSLSTSVIGQYRKAGGEWVTVFDKPNKARYFKFSRLQFSKMTFRCDKTPRTLTDKLNIHKVDKAGFRFCNSELNEPFGIEAIAFEYTQSGVGIR